MLHKQEIVGNIEINKKYIFKTALFIYLFTCLFYPALAALFQPNL